MKTLKTLTMLICILGLCSAAFATPPNANIYNIDFNTNLKAKPEKIGDLIEISWDFTFKKFEDTSIQNSLDKSINHIYAKAFLSVVPSQEYYEGDTTQWIEIHYDKTYTFKTVYKIINHGLVSVKPRVYTFKELNNDKSENRISRNKGKGFSFTINPNTKNSDTLMIDTTINDKIFTIVNPDIIKEFGRIDTLEVKITPTNDTISFSNNVDLPPEFNRINAEIKFTPENATDDGYHPLRSLPVDVDLRPDNDTITVKIEKVPTFAFVFYANRLPAFKIINSSNADIIENTENGFKIDVENIIPQGTIKVQFENWKNIYFKFYNQ